MNSKEDDDSDISVLLERAAQSDARAEAQLFERVESELRIIARGLLKHERAGHSWQTVDLVNEVAVKLINANLLKKNRNRAYFFAAVSNAMRQLLIDHARQRSAKKRPQDSVPLDEVLDSIEQEGKIDILSLHESLEELKTMDERKHDVVHLRFFGGLNFKEIAEFLGVSLPT
ncbi:MAG: sigma-70 family RNA polymerase sigma factor, partial [Planctomycetales bacterium]|nr:sigma-70 family RNA polymerase sigma factor [Planctomycetales bacterium]